LSRKLDLPAMMLNEFATRLGLRQSSAAFVEQALPANQ